MNAVTMEKYHKNLIKLEKVLLHNLGEIHFSKLFVSMQNFTKWFILKNSIINNSAANIQTLMIQNSVLLAKWNFNALKDFCKLTFSSQYSSIFLNLFHIYHVWLFFIHQRQKAAYGKYHNVLYAKASVKFMLSNHFLTGKLNIWRKENTFIILLNICKKIIRFVHVLIMRI